MHNKSFTVDGVVTIIGGRNIADEYFSARQDSNFKDLDVVAVGPIVAEVSGMFDACWNHPQSLPIPAFIDVPEDISAQMEALRQIPQNNKDNITGTAYAETVASQISDYLDTDLSAFEWAEYELVYDSPDKMYSREAPDEDRMIITPLFEHLQKAEFHVIVVSPYFVPLDSGIRFFSELNDRGANVSIITNSLAANNQFTVHGGYAHSRIPLLKNGVNLFEVRPDANVEGTEVIAASGSKATLHTKAFLIDNNMVFIGSFNCDPRSALINSEMGVLIHSPALAQQFVENVTATRETDAYTLFLNEDEKLRWRSYENGQEVILDKEPETTWWQRTVTKVISWLPVKGQL